MTFNDIIGHDSAIKILENAMRQDRLPAAFLFAGPQGIGKSTIARKVAKALNCEQESFASCNQCSSCVRIEKNQFPDVHTLAGEESGPIKIEHVRQLQQNMNLRAFEAKKKVCIIDPAHCLTPEAGNALLKILEEPPKDSLFILITSKPAFIPQTIISRCQMLKFYPLQRSVLEEMLVKDHHLNKPLAHFLAYFCEGRIGSALALKESQILSYKNKLINDFVLSRDYDCEEAQFKGKEEVSDCLNILASWFRDLYLLRIGIAHNELIHLDRKNELLKAIQEFSFAQLEEILEALSDSAFYLQHNINMKLLLSNVRLQLWK